MVQLRSRLSEPELKKKKETNRNLLVQAITGAIKFMNELTNAPSSKKTNELVEKRIDEVVDFLTKLEETKLSEKREDERNPETYKYLTLDEMQKETDKLLENSLIKINWYDYVKVLFEDIRDDAADFLQSSNDLIIIQDMKQFKEVLQIFSEASQKVISRLHPLITNEKIFDSYGLVSAIWWLVVNSVSPYATSRFQDLHYEYKTKVDENEFGPGNWQCRELVKDQYPYLFAYMFIKDNSPDVFKQREKVDEMMTNIRAAYWDTILHSKWLDGKTKMAALAKLRNITQNVSFKDWMTDPKEIEEGYKEIVVSPKMFYNNVRSNNLTKRKQQLRILGQDNLLSPYQNMMYPLTVNACYTPLINAIDIPIGILGRPRYNLGLEALNYGAIGSVLAHEVGHAFDNMGKRYDSWGKKQRWWKKKTAEKYGEKSKCFVDFYDGIYIRQVDQKVDGHLTVDENIADFLGVQNALKAYRKYVEKYGKEKPLVDFENVSHEKLLTMAFATQYCTNYSPSFLRFLMEKDEHSPNMARVLGTLKNTPDFADIWSCSPDQKMNPEKKCGIW
ncbi:hypothetical protein V9T40_002603 [Parthenolecanium corni]|uniref:Uncharacterized protein n=1 Tax=Parthenolecanium corni TaxID=536013 RepID=A0AAN9TH08_9HEMI